MSPPAKIRSPSHSAESVFAYLDYRDFLAYRYEQRKRREPGYSHRDFALEAGFASPSILSKVLNGNRNLAAREIGKLSQALGLREKEREYFRILIRFNQAATLPEKRVHYSSLILLAEWFQGQALQAYQENAMDNAKLAMHALPKEERHISTLTLGVSASTYMAMEEELLAFKDRIRNLVQSDKPTSRIYQFTLALFPASHSR